MLTRLRIRNLALVEDLNLEFGPGFHAITGETGAGKSIVIGALSLLLGQRADRALLRAGADTCSVEGLLDVSGLRAPLPRFLEENGLEPCEGGQLILKRVFTAAGANRQFVNGSAATLQVLAALGEWLVDIHGPHDHQSLFQPSRQLEMLDAFAGHEAVLGEFRARFDERREVEAAKAALVVDDRTYAQQVDLLRHQVSEIGAARLRADEENGLVEDHRRAQNSTRLLETAHSALAMLSESEEALLTQAGQLGRLVQDLVRLDAGAADMQTTHGQAMDLLRDLQSALSVYVDRVDVDPMKLKEMEERLDLIQSLRRKYGNTVTEVMEFGEQARERLAMLEGRDAERARLQTELERLDREIRLKGEKLTASRKAAIPKLRRAVVAQLRDLGFKRSEFDVALTPLEGPVRSGCDALEFLFAPNPGEPARRLRDIASSGELARVMLALKTVLASEDDVPVLVFDEVDANVGGETAHAVGEKMRQIGRQRQVLCITHQAPVAAAAGRHFLVSKAGRDGRTVTEIEDLNGTAREMELARMLGGGEAAKRHAEALLAGRS